MIQKIQKIDNNINMQAGFKLFPRRYSTHTPTSRLYEEFEFMPELKKKNPIKSFFKEMMDNIKGIREAMKPEQNETAKSSGMTFEA